MILYHFTAMENVEAIQRDEVPVWIAPNRYRVQCGQPSERKKPSPGAGGDGSRCSAVSSVAG